VELIKKVNNLLGKLCDGIKCVQVISQGKRSPLFSHKHPLRPDVETFPCSDLLPPNGCQDNSSATIVKHHNSTAAYFIMLHDRLCGLVVRVLGYRSRNQGSIPGTTRKKAVGLERGPLSLVSTTEEL
jgi:hypothetical protein